MDWKQIGMFIAKLRKEKGMTQEELADKLASTRHSISKWENGVNTPNTEVLLKLGEIFDISINEILACKRRTEDNAKEVDNISINLISDNKKKIKKLIKIFSIIICSLIIIFLVYYFINTYSSLYVYRVAGESDIFSTFDGIAIFSKNKSYLKLGNINSKNNINDYECEIFYNYNNKENVILKSQNGNELLVSIYGSNNYFTYKNKDQIIKNTYLRIKYDGKEEIIKLNFQRDMVNNKILFFGNQPKVTENDNYNNSIIENIDKIEAKILKNFSYNEDEENYFINGNMDGYSYKIKYSDISKNFEVYEYRDEIYIYEFDLIFNELKYSKYNDEKIDDIFIYSFDNKECISGNCEEVESFINKYYNKYIKD